VTEEEIKELALQFGLNPGLLVLFEPHAANSLYGNGARQYSFRYSPPGQHPLDWSFVVTGEQIALGREAVVVWHFVVEGLMSLSKLIGAAA
jgi:hypothetical protein